MHVYCKLDKTQYHDLQFPSLVDNLHWDLSLASRLGQSTKTHYIYLFPFLFLPFIHNIKLPDSFFFIFSLWPLSNIFIYIYINRIKPKVLVWPNKQSLKSKLLWHNFMYLSSHFVIIIAITMINYYFCFKHLICNWNL